MSLPASGALVTFGWNAVMVSSDHPLIAEALQTHFRHCGVLQADVIANLHITATSDTHFMGSVDGSDFFSNLGYEQALWLVMNEVITRLNANCTGGLVFHAAALASAKDAIILCGGSGCGKSSLAAWLTADGFHYLTDEVIQAPLEEDHITGLTRSIVLKRSSAFIWQTRLPDQPSPGFLSFQDGSVWIDPQLFHPNAAKSTATPRLLIFPCYEAGAPLQTRKLTGAEALFRLLQTLVNARNLPGHGMDAATRLARQVTAYSLTYSNLEDASAWIHKTFQE